MSAEDELARLERQVLGVRRISSFSEKVAELRRMLAREDPAIRSYVLKLTAPKIGRDLVAAVESAWGIGIADAVNMLDSDEPLGVRGRTAPAAFVNLAVAAERIIAQHMADARSLARAGADPDAVLAKVFAADNTLKREVASVINRAGNAGVTAVADAAGVPTVWIAEVNACVTCLAYSGRVAAPGRDFPGGLTYGATSTVAAPIPHPPAHPSCRCNVEPLGDQSYADSLRREADRSVLRGFSLESEPMSVRIKAAEKLLAEGVQAPKSVKAYAAAAVRRGEFTTRGRP